MIRDRSIAPAGRTGRGGELAAERTGRSRQRHPARLGHHANLSEVLTDGTFMLQHPCNACVSDPNPTVDDALLNAKTLRWTVIRGTGKDDPNDEEGWTLEPSGQVLTLDTWIPAAT